MISILNCIYKYQSNTDQCLNLPRTVIENDLKTAMNPDLLIVFAYLPGVSEIQFPHIYGGHVKLNGQEICYRSFSTTAGEMLCQSKGFKYGFHNRYIFTEIRTLT